MKIRDGFGVNEDQVVTMFDFTEHIHGVTVCRMPGLRREHLPTWVRWRDDGVMVHFPDPPTKS